MTRVDELKALLIDLKQRTEDAEREIALLLTPRKLGERVHIKGTEIEISTICMHYGRVEVRYRKVLKNGTLGQQESHLYGFDIIDEDSI